MPYTSFHSYFPDIVEKETRSVTLFSDDNEFDLPKGNYDFLESYCDECCCRMVFFIVLKEGNPLATVYWGWENVKFYQRWYGSKNINVKRELIGPALNPLSPATEHSQKIVKLISTLLLSDKNYVDRLKRHYRLFRQTVNQKIK